MVISCFSENVDFFIVSVVSFLGVYFFVVWSDKCVGV